MSPNDTSEITLIPLNRKQFTVVDLVDSDLSQHKWRAAFNPSYSGGGKFLAVRSIWQDKTRKTVAIHRVILSRILGRELTKDEIVDHINGDPLDNRRSNLRPATSSQNCINRARRKDNTSGYKGVSWYSPSKKWKAQICVNRETTFLGYFDTPEEAYAAYCEAAKEKHGKYARLK